MFSRISIHSSSIYKLVPKYSLHEIVLHILTSVVLGIAAVD